MPSLIDSATSILVASEARARSSGNDIANASTSGYKQEVAFSEVLEAGFNNRPFDGFVSDFSQGQLVETNKPLDLAIFGPALLSLRDDDRIVFSRGGQFSLGENGLLENPAGQILQDALGGDLVIGAEEVEFLADGTVLENGLPTGAVALVEAVDPQQIKALGGSVFAADLGAMLPATQSALRQGYIEKSNVVLSDEMITMMTAVRQAETGARVTQFYDQLMGQAISTFSRGSR